MFFREHPSFAHPKDDTAVGTSHQTTKTTQLLHQSGSQHPERLLQLGRRLPYGPQHHQPERQLRLDKFQELLLHNDRSKLRF